MIRISNALAPPSRDLTVRAPRWPLRRLAAVTCATFASVLALSIGLQALFSSTPLACGSDCAAVLGQHRFSVVLGIPAIAWASALHVVLCAVTWSLVLAPRRHQAILQAVQLGLVAVLLGGSATYLVLGLVTDVRCVVCITMHALAVLAALGVAILPRDATGVPAMHRLAATGLALAAWVALAWGLAQAQSRARVARAAPAASTEKWLAAVCEPATCPGAARFGPEAMPDDDASIVLGKGPGPTLVAWLDLDCAACRADFKTEEPLFRRLVRSHRGLRLVLRASSRACDARARGGDARLCEAPAAVICAARHAGPEAALTMLGWELAAEPGYYTLADRRQTLAAMAPMAARCLDSELALGPGGSLAEHAEAARRLAAHAADHAGCERDADPAWWCFAATPGFAIVDSTPRTSPSAAFASATGELRREVLEQCLEVSP